MKKGGSDKSAGGATVGDSLSAGMKARMAKLKEDLERKVKATIQAQLKQAKAPWQKRGQFLNPPNHSMAPLVITRALGGGDRLQPTKLSKPASPQKDTFQYWNMPPEMEVREKLPESIPSQERDEFEELLLAGSSRAVSATGEDLHVIVGLDFGTSSTKVIVRFPYETGAPTVAIPIPVNFRSEGQPYLWRTAIWLHETGDFCAWPAPGTRLLHSLKQGLVGGHADSVIISARGECPDVSRADAAAAFLAYVIRYVRGWLLINRPAQFRGRQPVWSINMGFPAAKADNPSMVSAYRRVTAAALQMANIDGSLSVEATRMFLGDENIIATANSVEKSGEMGIAIIPEVAAEVTGFAKSTRSAPGLYLMVDVGAMTFDACTFRLQIEQMNNPCAIFTAHVHPLGVEAYHWFLKQGKSEGDFVLQCARSLREVVWDTKKARDPRAENWKRGNNLSVFLVGGGAENQLHRQTVLALGPWLKQHTGNDGINCIDLPRPTGLSLPEPISNFARLAVAWGLSYPPNEIGPVELPSSIEDIPPLEVIDSIGRFISKDQV